MPDLFDINFNQQAIDLLPPDKRDETIVAKMQALLSPLQWCQNLINVSYKIGATAPAYSPGTYAKYNQVVYKKAVYESLVDGNIFTPDDATAWMKIQGNFIGVDERILYNGTKLVFEWALNKWFSTQFRQPPLLSDIYLTKNATGVPVFRMGANDAESSSVGLYASSENIYDDYTFATSYGMTINIPTAVYDALGIHKETIVRNFADLYVTAGVKYNIQPY